MKRCGRPLSSSAHEFFEYDEEEDESTCISEGCSVKIAGKHAGNLAKHLRRAHDKEYVKYLEKKREKEIEKSEPRSSKRPFLKVFCDAEKIRRGLVKLVTLNGRPFSLMQDEGLRDFLDPLLESLGEEKFVVSPESIENETRIEAANIRQEIKEELKEVELISVKCDIASRHGKSFLAVNVQFIKNGKIQLRTLAAKVLEERHTSYYLRNVIRDILQEFNILVDDIYTCTTDNGANMIKMTNILQEDQENIFAEEDMDIGDTEEEKNSEEEVVQESDEEDYLLEENNGEHPEECQHEFENLQEIVDGKGCILTCVRCGAHTLQLSVWDVLKKKIMNQTLNKARKAVKVLRTETFSTSLKRYNISKPVLDVPTRWGTTDDMLESLHASKQFCTDFSSTRKELKIPDATWKRIEDCLAALKPIKIATVRLQAKQLHPGDFYGLWLECKLRVGKVDSRFARALLASMKIREKMLLDNDALLASIYLDPRYLSFICTKENVEAEARARNMLKQLWLRLEKRDQNAADQNVFPAHGTEDQAKQTEEGEDSSDDILETELAKFNQERLFSEKDTLSAINIQELLLDFRKIAPLKRKDSLLEFWEAEKLKRPHLYRLAILVHAVPMTQVSVERLFSGLKFIFSDLRGNLAPGLINDILLVRTNGLYKKNNTNEKRKKVSIRNKTTNKNLDN